MHVVLIHGLQVHVVVLPPENYIVSHIFKSANLLDARRVARLSVRSAALVVALVVAKGGALSVAHEIGRVLLADYVVVATDEAGSAAAAVLLVTAVKTPEGLGAVAQPSEKNVHM
jgi:hypothetical protein